MTIEDKFQTELNAIRQNSNLLENYRFKSGVGHSKHFDRLRLNIAIYNDFRQSDYDIVSFLFGQELLWRKDNEEKDGDVDNLYFSAFLLTHFENPEIIWLFIDTKNIDFDSSIGFDGEYLLAMRITKTYRYLHSVEHPLKNEVLNYIGYDIDNCQYSQEDIDEWKEFKRSYFRAYKFPIMDEMFFLFSVNEKELLTEKLPEWIVKSRTWTYEELSLFKTYAKYSGNKQFEIDALILALGNNDNVFSTNIYKKELAELYIDTNQQAKAIEILNNVIHHTDNKNIIRDCIEQLCRIVIFNNDKHNSLSVISFDTTKKQQKKYGHFSPNVDQIINTARQIMSG